LILFLLSVDLVL
jgi:hypothetical protein